MFYKKSILRILNCATLRYSTTSTLLFFALSLWSASSVSGNGTFRLSMMPIFSSGEIQQRIAPLAQYLSDETGLQIETAVASDFAAYNEIAEGDNMIAFSNPVFYASGTGRHEAIAIASKGEQGTRFRGLIVTRRDSGIDQISDLAGKVVGYNGRRAAAAHLSQRLTLLDHGLDTLRDLQLKTPVNNKQENTLLSVYVGDLDAGFVRESALQSVQDYIPSQSLVVLAKTEWIPQWTLSVSRKMPAVHRAAIEKAILQLKTGHPVLTALKIDSFQAASDADFDSLRRAIP